MPPQTKNNTKLRPKNVNKKTEIEAVRPSASVRPGSSDQVGPPRRIDGNRRRGVAGSRRLSTKVFPRSPLSPDCSTKKNKPGSRHPNLRTATLDVVARSTEHSAEKNLHMKIQNSATKIYSGAISSTEPRPGHQPSQQSINMVRMRLLVYIAGCSYEVRLLCSRRSHQRTGHFCTST